MSKRNTLIGVLLLVVAALGAGAWWWKGQAAPTDEAATVDSGAAKKALLEKKLAARARGDIDLSPCSALGKVTRAADGKAIEGAQILLTPKGFDQGQPSEPGQPADPITIVTDAGGGWEIGRVSPGRYTLSASAEGYLPASNVDVILKAAVPNGGLDLALTEGGFLLSGTISDIGGGPVEGAMVQVFRMGDGSPLSMKRAPAAALTKDDGTYRVTVAEGDYALGTFHSDYVAAQRLTSVRGGPRVEDFVLTPGGVIEGRVIARGTGDGVGDALVTFTNSRGAFATAGGGFTLGGFGEGRVTSAADGSFRLRGLQSGVVQLSVVADGYATREPVEVPIGVAEQVSGIEIVVDPAFKISGFAVAKGNEEQGLEGVLVGAFSFTPPALFVARGPTDPDGYFEILGVPPGGYNVGAMGEDALPNLMGTGASVVDKDVTDVLVVMDRGASVTGRVEPAMAASISIGVEFEGLSMGDMLGTIGNAMAQTRSDAEEGTFTLRPITPGKLKIVAKGDDGQKGEIEVEVPPEGLEGIVITLTPRASVAGRVLDSTGAAVADANVEFAPRKSGTMNMQMNMGGRQEGQFPVGEDGSYHARGLEAGKFDVLVKDRKGRVLGWAQPIDPEKPQAPIEVSLEDAEQKVGYDLSIEARNGVIRGTVFDADGAPLADAWVTAVREEKISQMMGGDRREDENVVKAEVRVGSGGADPSAENDPSGSDLPMWFAESPVLTDPNGLFAVENLKPGKYTLVGEGMKGSARAKATGAEPGDTVTLQLERLAGISGSVTRKGKPVQEYTVTLKGPSNRSKTVRNADGTFLVDRIDPGEYEVTATAKDGQGMVEVEVEAGQSSKADIKLKGFGTVRGVLVDANGGAPIVGANIMVQPREGGGFDGSMIMNMFTGMGPRTDASGAFEVGDVRPGKNVIAFMDRDAAMSGGAIASENFEIEAEQEKDLGTIQGLPASKIPPDERGDLGMRTSTASFDKRPMAPGSQDADEKDEDEDAAEGSGDDRERLWVFSITKDGPAADAGVEPGDEIVSIDGRDVSGVGAQTAQMMLSRARLTIGQTVSLELDRDGSGKSVSIKTTAKDDEEDPETGQ